jgi:hypothetical protein
MITKDIKVNGTEFRVTLTDSIISQVNSLKSLYNQAYEDPQIFEQISSEISDTIQTISSASEPKAKDSDLDGLIQEIIKIVDSNTAAVEKASQEKTHKTKKNKKS